MNHSNKEIYKFKALITNKNKLNRIYEVYLRKGFVKMIDFKFQFNTGNDKTIDNMNYYMLIGAIEKIESTSFPCKYIFTELYENYLDYEYRRVFKK